LRDDVAEAWGPLSRLKDVTFFLYVPAGHADDAKKLVKAHKVKDVKLRTWRHITGLKTIDIAHIK
jgi:hypothetical protein